MKTCPPKAPPHDLIKANLKRSFTLIELLIVIAILGVLAAAVLVAINPAKRSKQARDAIRRHDSGVLRNALTAYNTINVTYPVTGGWIDSRAGNQWIVALINSGDLKTIPVDPVNTFPNPPTGPELIYYLNSNASDFCLQISLEIDPGSDPYLQGYWGSAYKLRYASDGTRGGPTSLCQTT